METEGQRAGTTRRREELRWERVRWLSGQWGNMIHGGGELRRGATKSASSASTRRIVSTPLQISVHVPRAPSLFLCRTLRKTALPADSSSKLSGVRCTAEVATTHMARTAITDFMGEVMGEEAGQGEMLLDMIEVCAVRITTSIFVGYRLPSCTFTFRRPPELFASRLFHGRNFQNTSQCPTVPLSPSPSVPLSLVIPLSNSFPLSAFIPKKQKRVIVLDGCGCF